MLGVHVRYDEKDATVRYVPGKVTLDQILARYDDTPFRVVPSGPVITVARTPDGLVRSWSERGKTDAKDDKPNEIQLFVEAKPAGIHRTFTLTDPPAAGLALLQKFEGVQRDFPPTRYVAKLYERIALSQGEIVVPIKLEITGKDKKTHKLEVVIRTPRRDAKPSSAETGVALLGGTLELQLGHLCDQRGCVHHFHDSLRDIPGLAAVKPHPDMHSPRATLYLRAGQPIDVGNLRQTLRDRSIEVTSIVPSEMNAYRLRVELPRWRSEDTKDIRQCASCRERVVEALAKLAWATDVTVAGGGINLRPKNLGVNVVTLLDTLTSIGSAPSAVWLVPVGVPMPKAPPPMEVRSQEAPKQIGSQAHPLVQVELSHTSSVGTELTSLLHQQKWASHTEVRERDTTTIAQLAIGDRKFANLSPLLEELRKTGQTPRAIRLRGFGDIRIQLEFAHICGDVVSSKPPKPKKRKPGDKGVDKPKKPFVPQPVSMAKTSNGRRAIEAAIQRVSWVKNGLFYAYHTKFEFRGGPRKITFALQAREEDVVRLDKLIDELRKAGYPPKSIVVSRRFPGIPFGKPLPGDVELTDGTDKQHALASFKKPKRPLVVAFFALNPQSKAKYKKYKADPKFFARLGQWKQKYQDRVDVVAIHSNEHDKRTDVETFWKKTGLTMPLLHDPDGIGRAVFNVQIAPPPHIFVFDAEGLLRYAGDAHSHWEKPGVKYEDYLTQALELVFVEKYLNNGAVFYNKAPCNCSHPRCKCPKCGCGSSCRCGIGHCGVGF